MTINERIEEKELTKITYRFLLENGFDPKNYQKILEISGYPETSITALLKEYNNIILLSYLSCSKHTTRNIEIRRGDIVNGQIIYPKEEAEKEMGLKLKARDYNYSYPKIDTFDALVSTQLTSRAFQLVNTDQDKFFAFTLNDKNEIRASLLLKDLNEKSKYPYISTEKEIATRNGVKTLRLIRPKYLRK